MRTCRQLLWTGTHRSHVYSSWLLKISISSPNFSGIIKTHTGSLKKIARPYHSYKQYYSLTWRWLALDINQAAKLLGKYPLLATDTEVNSCFRIYQNSEIIMPQKVNLDDFVTCHRYKPECHFPPSSLEGNSKGYLESD